MALGIVLLWGPRGALFLMSEVPLYRKPLQHRQERTSSGSIPRSQAEWGIP